MMYSDHDIEQIIFETKTKNMFYNKTHLKGTELKQAHQRAISQEDILLAFFKANPYGQFCRSDLENLKVLNAPTASYVRALNTLSDKQGAIVRLDKQKVGEYGSKQHLYCLKVEFEQKELF